MAWMVPILGGRLRLVRWRRSSVDRLLAADLRLLLAGGLIGAGVIHAAVVGEHFDEWPAAGYFFVALTVSEVTIAAAVILGPARWWPVALAVVLSVGPLTVWTYSRARGLPFGPEPGRTEAVGLPDVLACALEVATTGIALLVLRDPLRLRHRKGSAHSLALAALAILTATAIGVAATGSIGFDRFGVRGTEMAGAPAP